MLFSYLLFSISVRSVPSTDSPILLPLSCDIDVDSRDKWFPRCSLIEYVQFCSHSTSKVLSLDVYTNHNMAPVCLELKPRM